MTIIDQQEAHPTDAEATPSRPTGAHLVVVDWVIALGSLTTFVGALAIIWLPSWITAQDLPAQLLGINVMLHPDRYDWLEPNIPLTQLVLNGVIVALEPVSDLLRATQIALTLGLMGWCAVWFSLAKRWGGDAVMSAGVAAASWVGWSHVMGFSNYSFGLLLGLAALAVLSEPDFRRRGLRVGSAALLFVASAAGHVFAAGHIIVLATIWAAHQRTRRAAIDAAIAVGPSAAYSACVVIYAYLGGREGIGNNASGWQMGGIASRAVDLAGAAFVGYSSWAWGLGALSVGAVALFILVNLRHINCRPVTLFYVLAGMFLFLVLPDSGLGWAWVAQRVVAPTVLIAIASLPRDLRASRILAPALALSAAVAVISALPVARQLGEQSATTIESFGAADPGRAYAVLYRSQTNVPAPHATIDVGEAGYSLLNGGMMPGMFATNPAIHWALFTAPPSQLVDGVRSWFFVAAGCDVAAAECVARLAEEAEHIAVHALPFDSVVCVHPPPPLEAELVNRGFSQLSRNIWRVPRAQLSVNWPAGSDVSGVVGQLVMPKGEIIAQAEVGELDGRGVAIFSRIPAGPAELRFGRGNELLFRAPVTLEGTMDQEINLGQNAGSAP